jgi:transglutaminase-like putative cysteine protease
MRIRISHQTTFSYAPPARSVIQNIRLTPRSFDSQYVSRWRVNVDLDGVLRHGEDSLGNVVNAFTYHKAVERFTIAAVGEVETTDAVGVVRGAFEPLQLPMFLRASPVAQASAKLRELVAETVGESSDALDKLHRLMKAVHEGVECDPKAPLAQGGAAEALALGRAAPADVAHIFVAAARSLEIPARLVTGYVAPEDGEAVSDMDVWAEAFAPGLGWIAFDAVRDLCANDRYVRVAAGFDYASAQPFRTTHSGMGVETIETTLTVQNRSARGPSQSQHMG